MILQNSRINRLQRKLSVRGVRGILTPHALRDIDYQPAFIARATGADKYLHGVNMSN